MLQDIFLFETRTGDEKDDNNNGLQRFGVLHRLQREIVKRKVSYGSFSLFLSEEGVTRRNVGDYYYCHLFRHPFVSQIKIYPTKN